MTNNEIGLIFFTALIVVLVSRIILLIIVYRKKEKLLKILTFDYVLQLHSDAGLDWDTLSIVLIYVRQRIKELT
ncbi:MAG TPA: hypothetical protein ENI23_07315 [bacterium]|nr:hypothetical protein [bacterium]